MGVGWCGRDVDEALESFPFVRNVSLLGLLAAEEKAGAEILGILLAGAGAGEGEGERSWRGELGRLRPRGEEGRLRARFIARSSSTLLQKQIVGLVTFWELCSLLLSVEIVFHV